MGDLGLIPELGRSPGEGIGYPLQHSGLKNSMDCIVHGVAESDTTERTSLSFIDVAHASMDFPLFRSLNPNGYSMLVL